MTTSSLQSIPDTARFLVRHGVRDVTVGMILGTGFGRFVDHLDVEVSLPYSHIPKFPVSTVADHAGNLVCGRIRRTRVLVMQGRIHRYEGYPPDVVTYPVRVMHRLGISTLIITNAAGGLNPYFSVGDLMLIDDHINMMGGSILDTHEERIAPAPPFYAPALNGIALSVARTHRIALRRGILSAMLGPSFETPAEIVMLRRLGADAVTMSTIPEVVAANALGMRVMGVSCISNQCVGRAAAPVDHETVMAVVRRAGDRFSTLMQHVTPALV